MLSVSAKVDLLQVCSVTFIVHDYGLLCIMLVLHYKVTPHCTESKR